MPHTANILAAYDAATAADQAQGLAWYGLAQEFAQTLSLDSSLSVEQCAGVIAAMSPMMSWRSNLDVARRLITHYQHTGLLPDAGYGLRRNVAKAWAILDGAPPLEVLSGPKVRAFYRNIMGDPSAVTVDRWAVRIALADPTHPGTVTAKGYGVIAEAYRDAADLLEVSARDLQAATWTYYRRVHGATHNDPEA